VRGSFALITALVFAISPAIAKPANFAKESVSRGGKDGAVMFTAPLVPGDYVIMFSPYDAASNTVHGSEFVNVRSFKFVAAPKGAGSLQIHRMPPGFYVVRMITTQGWWGACLADDTIGFDVKAGQITWLGRMDPAPTLESIQAEAYRTGKTTSSGGQLRLFKENVKPPQFGFADAVAPAEAIETARAAGFVTDAPVVSVKPAPQSYHRTDKTDLTGFCK
jgi:hypothetical protein